MKHILFAHCIAAMMRTILGVAVGATFTWALLVTMAGMWTTLILVPLMVFLIGLVGVPYFQRLWGFDFATSYYGAMPGGLQDMLLFGEEAGGDVRALSLIHATRVMVIVVALPFILNGYWGVDLSNPPGVPAANLPVTQLILMVVCGVAGWQIAKAVGLFGASILGPMILAAILALSGVLQHRPPAARDRGRLGLLSALVGVIGHLRRSDPPVPPRPANGNPSGVCTGRSGRNDSACLDRRGRHGVCDRASRLADHRCDPRRAHRRTVP